MTGRLTIAVLLGWASAAGAQIELAVDAGADRHPIPDDVYGIHYTDDTDFAAEIRLPVRRWGGNDASRYNWTLNAFNNGSDYFFENNPRGFTADQYIARHAGIGTQTIVTIPLLGFVAKDTTSCGFHTGTYGYVAEATDPFRPLCGNGIRAGDGSLVEGVDPFDTSIAIDPSFATQWIDHLIDAHGPGGVRFYSLDNEPGLWHETHRDVHPAPLGYAEIRDSGIAYAAAIKAADPAAQVFGPVQDGWTRYFFASYLTYEQATGDRDGAGEGIDFIPWYLREMKAYEDANGTRLLDYLDVHYYPQAPGVTLSGAGDAATQARRLRSVKSLFDDAYVDESWIADAGPDGGVIQLVPRMRGWIDARYPGTRLAITEYNFGGLEHVNGALAQADVLGIFGRDGVDLATFFDTPYSGGAFTSASPAAFAFRVYRNYDGAGGSFGDVSVAATSSDFDQISIYAAERSSDGSLTIVLVNKTAASANPTASVAGFATAFDAEVWRYAEANLGAIVRQPDVAAQGGAFTLSLPARSITLVRAPEAGATAVTTVATVVLAALRRSGRKGRSA